MAKLRSLAIILDTLRKQYPLLYKKVMLNPDTGIVMACADLKLLLDYIAELENNLPVVTLEQLSTYQRFKPSLRNRLSVFFDKLSEKIKIWFIDMKLRLK